MSGRNQGYMRPTKADTQRRIESDGPQRIHTYAGIQVEPNRWIIEACEEAKRSVKAGGGPFGAVLVQMDDETGDVIRFWRGRNQVAESNDPTAHAEITVIRSACRDLGVYDLSKIKPENGGSSRRGATSHCELYSSCEPCPMCYSAMLWARIPVLVFSATRYEASQPDVGFSDSGIHEELGREYTDRSIRVRQSICPCALEPFEDWKRSSNPRY